MASSSRARQPDRGPSTASVIRGRNMEVPAHDEDDELSMELPGADFRAPKDNDSGHEHAEKLLSVAAAAAPSPAPAAVSEGPPKSSESAVLDQHAAEPAAARPSEVAEVAPVVMANVGPVVSVSPPGQGAASSASGAAPNLLGRPSQEGPAAGTLQTAAPGSLEQPPAKPRPVSAKQQLAPLGHRPPNPVLADPEPKEAQPSGSGATGSKSNQPGTSSEAAAGEAGKEAQPPLPPPAEAPSEVLGARKTPSAASGDKGLLGWRKPATEEDPAGGQQQGGGGPSVRPVASNASRRRLASNEGSNVPLVQFKSTIQEETGPAAGEGPMMMSSEVSEKPDSAAMRLLRRYARLMVRCPCLFLVLYLVGFGVLIGAAWRPFVLEQNFSAFMKADVQSSRNMDALSTALGAKKDLNSRRLMEDNEQVWLDHTEPRLEIDGTTLYSLKDQRDGGGPGQGPGRQLQSNSLFIVKTLVLLFSAKNGNALDEKVLRDAKSFEGQLRSLPSWRSVCLDLGVPVPVGNQQPCDVGVSFSAMVWPTETPPSAAETWKAFQVIFNGKGNLLWPLNATLAYQRWAFDTGGTSRNPSYFFPRDYTLQPAGSPNPLASPPKALRSIFSFQLTVAPLGSSLVEIKSGLNRVTTAYNNLINNEVYPLVSNLGSGSTQVFYSGDQILDHEVSINIINDLLKAIASVVLVLLYLIAHTRSVVVSFVSIFTLLLSIPVAYVLTPAPSTTIVDLASIFLVIGAGEERVIFVFFDSWEQGSHLENLDDRMAYMMTQAGLGAFAAAIATSVSFFANLASTLPALRKFGLFMGLCVMSTFFQMVMILPLVMVLMQQRHDRMAKKREVDISRGEEGHLSVLPTAPRHVSSVGLKTAAVGASNLGWVDAVLLRMLSWIGRWPITVTLISFLWCVIFVIGTAVTFKLDQSTPTLFPKSHNQVAGQRLLSSFSTVTAPLFLPNATNVCNPTEMLPARFFQGSDASDCSLNWCSVPTSAVAPNVTQSADNTSAAGTCWSSPIRFNAGGLGAYVEGGTSTKDCGNTQVLIRYSAPFKASEAEARKLFSSVLPLAMPTASAVPAPFGTGQELPPLAIETWDTGSVVVNRLFQLTTIAQPPYLDSTKVDPYRAPVNATCTSDTLTCQNGTVLNRDPLQNCTFPQCASAVCQMRVMCFMGTTPCQFKGWTNLGQFNLGTAGSTRRLDSEAPNSEVMRQDTQQRRLQTAIALAPQLVRSPVAVTVVYGLTAPKWTPIIGTTPVIWAYDPSFQPSNPWAQRAMLSMCSNFPPGLVIFNYLCWVQSFQQFQLTNKLQFPSRDFSNDLVNWYQNGDQLLGQMQLWMESRKMKACRLQFTANVESSISAQTALSYMAQWDAFVGQQNAAASITANRAWHTASIWVSSQAQVAIVLSTAETIIITAVCGWGTILIFTGDPVLAGIVLLIVLAIIVCLIFFMLVILGWLIGPIEVIALVLFTGYGITYNLQIATNYDEAHARDRDLLEAEVRTRLRRNGCADQATKSMDLSSPVAGGTQSIEPGRGTQSIEPILAAPTSPDGGGRRIRARDLEGRTLREARARVAVLRVGTAQLSAALSTILATIPLLFCTIQIFLKLGVVIIVVTVVSLIFSITTMPALLILIGPGPNPCYKQLFWRCVNRLRWRRPEPPQNSPGQASQQSLLG